MLMRHEYRDQPPPDDPIEFHVWVEANECDECHGTGIDLVVVGDLEGALAEIEDCGDEDDLPDCPACDGTGYTAAAQPYV